jgi:hypothetical protein
MAFTRFHDDDCRIRKQLQESTDQGRWILNVPGPGSNIPFIEDPQFRIQKWGANLYTNSINLESSLLGYNRPVNKDCLENVYTNYNVPSKPIEYPNNNTLTTGESRTTNPAWMYRDLPQVDWYFLLLNPQENTCIPFQSNLNTRILEKDHYNQKYECLSLSNQNVLLPVQESKHNRGHNLCSSSNSCYTL